MTRAGDDAEYKSDAGAPPACGGEERRMTNEPDQIRAQIDAVLAELPDPGDGENALAETDLDEIARRLSEAHDMLVRALESAEKG